MFTKGQQVIVLLCASLASAGAVPTRAQAGVHWRQADAFPGCFALAFNDSNTWLVNPKGVEIKKGTCHAGHEIAYRVSIAPGGNSFVTRDGMQTCHFSIDAADHVSESCDGGRPGSPTH